MSVLPRFEPALHWKHQEVLVELQGSWCNKGDFSRLSSTVFRISQQVANCITKLSQQAYFFSKYVSYFCYHQKNSSKTLSSFIGLTK